MMKTRNTFELQRGVKGERGREGLGEGGRAVHCEFVSVGLEDGEIESTLRRFPQRLVQRIRE